MSKLHLDLKAVSIIGNAYKQGSERISKISGVNLGNLVFRHALKFLISDFQSYRQIRNMDVDEELERGGIETILISCANWLGTKEQDEKSNKFRADLYEKIDAPLVSFGLGVQAPQDADCVDLGPESRRFARLLASKSELVSVRDEITARTLRSFGVDNVVVTGCPSNFINLDPHLGEKIRKSALAIASEEPSWKDLRTCITEVGGLNPQSGDLLEHALAVLRDHPAFYVLQSPVLLPLLYRESKDLPPVYKKYTRMEPEQVRRILRAKALAFSSVDNWLDFARTCDLSVGMRIHGNVVSVQAGVPSLLIGHDSRTSGLGETMGIPTVTPEEYLDLMTDGPGSIFRLIASKMEQYDDNRKKLGWEMERFLRLNGVKPSERFDNLVGKGSTSRQ